MRPPSPTFLRDRCTVYAPPAEAYDSEGAPSLLDGDPGEPLACLVDAAQPSGQPFARRGEAVPYGDSRRVLRFRSDPGVSRADQRLSVTVMAGVALAEPLELRSLGPAEPPYGIQNCWNVAADLKV